MEKKICVICESKYQPRKEDKGKCVSCGKLYPSAKSKADLLPEDENSPLKDFERKVKVVVYEVLAEAGMVRKKCEMCEEPFFAKSPAQRICKNCKETN